MKKQNKKAKLAKSKVIEWPFIKALLQLEEVGWKQCKDIKYILERDGEYALVDDKGEVEVI